MEHSLVTYLETFCPISDSCRDFIRQQGVTTTYKKNTFLLAEADVCTKLYFIHRGVLRGVKYYRDKEISTWFGTDNQLVTAFYSFVQEAPSYEGLQTLADTTVTWLSRAQWDELLRRFVEGNELGRKLAEHYYVWLEQRSMSMQYHTPMERYQHLLTTDPELLQRVPLTYIASYLGLARETLSRLRADRSRL